MCLVMSTDWIIPKEIPSDRTLHELSRQYQEADPTAIETLLTLLRAAADLHSALSQHFDRYNLSHGRFVVLIMLHTTPGGEMCCSDIADSVGVSRATMTGLLDGLERDGLVRRVDHAEDRRRVTITLTANGRRFLDEMLPGHFRSLARVMANLSENDRKKLRELLGKVRSGISALKP
jgi:DNA-binding MarR family transcriptional regulator